MVSTSKAEAEKRTPNAKHASFPNVRLAGFRALRELFD
jgi:hypothetical protein